MDFLWLVENLEKFGLEKFINANRFTLCRKTVNQNQIAAFLQFDADQIEIIVRLLKHIELIFAAIFLLLMHKKNLKIPLLIFLESSSEQFFKK